MLTPQNIREKSFEKAIFGGYDTGEVDNFLEQAAEDYAALAKETLALKSKIKVVVDKLKEYQIIEESMRQTLVTAQKIATQMENESKEKANAIIDEAKNEAERITREAHNIRANEEAKLLEAKRASSHYIESIKMICSNQLDFMGTLDSYKIEEAANAAPKIKESIDVEETIKSIENSVNKMADTDLDVSEVSRIVSDATRKFDPVDTEPTRTFSSQTMPSIESLLNS